MLKAAAGSEMEAAMRICMMRLRPAAEPGSILVQGHRQLPFTGTDLSRLEARAVSEPLAGLRLRPADPAKPAYLGPCNGCGVCCALEPCAIARQYIPGLSGGACPALFHEGSRYLCGMTLHPGLYMGLPNDWADPAIGSLFAAALGIGRGCDAQD